LGFGFRVSSLGFTFKGFNHSGLRAPGLRLGVQGSGLRVQGSGLRVQGSGLRVQGSGFRAQGASLKF